MFPNPKICIVFNSGAAGDFFVWLLSEQLIDLQKIKLEPTGAVIAPGQYFKMAARKFYETNFNSDVFREIPNEQIVCTHYCYPELLKLFPNCQFFYIDDSEYIHITIEMYIKKRVTSLIEWLHDRPNFPNVRKIKNISDDNIKQIMRNDWKKHLTLWKSLNFTAINLYDILHQDKCLATIKELLGNNIDVEKFSNSYREWAKNNTEFIYKVVNERL